jgi:predicted Zn-dependent protease with MMP-like domain
MPYSTSRRRFEELSEKALGSIPARYRRLFKNITVMVEDKPSDEVVKAAGVPRDELMGLFRGQTFGERDAFFELPSPYPDSIFLYQKNIEAVSETEEDLFDEIRMTIFHEVGHYFGLTEEELEEFEDP